MGCAQCLSSLQEPFQCLLMLTSQSDTDEGDPQESTLHPRPQRLGGQCGGEVQEVSGQGIEHPEPHQVIRQKSSLYIKPFFRKYMKRRNELFKAMAWWEDEDQNPQSISGRRKIIFEDRYRRRRASLESSIRSSKNGSTPSINARQGLISQYC